MGVKALHRDYTRYSPKWKRTRDVTEGQDAVHKAGTAYLPKLWNEEQADYDARLKRSDFWNGTWRTIDALSGMAFRKPPTVDVPKAIEPYLDDVTMSGTPMVSFARETVEEVLGPGRIGILVDHPPAPENVSALTVDAAQRLGLRPTLQHYTAESIRNWKFARINNAWVLSMVVLGEKHEEPKDEFESECVDRYRVLDLGGDGGTYRQRVFEVKDEKDVLIEEVIPLMHNKPLDFIPFFICGAGGRNDCIDEPPLIDLVDSNLALYQINAIYRHTLYFCPPTFYIAGHQLGDGEKVSVGGTSALVLPNPQAKAEYAEPEGNMVPELRNAATEKKQEMALLGARMIADETKQAETLGATQIKRAGENSVLAKIVEGVSEALEAALTVFAEWAGHPGEIIYQISREFMPTMMDSQTLTAIFAGVQAGQISERECFELLQRGDVIDGAKTYEAHQAEVDLSGGPARPEPKEPEEGIAA